MAKRRRKYRRKSKLKVKRDSLQSVLSLALFVGAIFTLFSFFGQAAEVGERAQTYLNLWFGWGSFFVPFVLANLGLILFDHGRNRFATWPFFGGVALLTVSVISLFHLFMNPETAQTEAMLGQGGGILGYYIQLVLRQSISTFLTFLILLALLIASVVLLFNTSLSVLTGYVSIALSASFTFFKENILSPLLSILPARQEKANADVYEVTDEPATFTISNGNEEEDEPVESETPVEDTFEVITPAFSPVVEAEPEVKPAPRIETVANSPFAEKVWEYPPLSLLAESAKVKLDQTHLNTNAKIIEDTLESFGVKAKVVEVNLGPAITQYALELSHGTKITKITNLQHDLAMALAAPTGTVRIEAPIPGKSLVGIEVPNAGLKIVNLKGMLASNTMQKNKSVLSVALGEDVSGNPVVADIARMPHVLIAGSTGSGKSVMINTIITTLLFRASPSEVKLILVDPKRVEMSQFRGIPHLLTDVIVDPDKVVSALKWALSEMDRRYRLFEKAGVRNINAYNEASGFQALPYIVILVDELGDIMMTAPREVESAICRLAQLARATGIHLIIATQRPSVDVLTGLIKANVPCRIAFNVSSMVDSRVIIDMPGAEKLLGKGDMLYVPPETSKAMRIQGVWVADKEINALIAFLKNSGFEPEYKQEIIEYVESSSGGGAGSSDDLFEDAVRMVCDEGAASTSLLQRKLRIGYNRAANLMDELEAAGVVGAQDGAKKRNVLITDPLQVLGVETNDTNEESGGDTPESPAG